MRIPIFQVDAFTDRPFAGNPAGVCILEREADEAWMQEVAEEMSVSETAFVVPGESTFGLRWFTPRAEVDLCGHATLASAHVLWETGRRRSWPIEFETRSGRLVASARGEWIQLDFPADPPHATECHQDWTSILGVAPVCSGSGRLYSLVVVESESVLRRIVPDLGALQQIEQTGLCVTARSESRDFDFVSRFFAPGLGVPEDPVTGSAHCMLGPYWGERLGKEELTAFQASRRGGVVRVLNRGARTILEGKAVTVLGGTLFAEPP